MKKLYQSPALEVERYRLDASIASNCNTVVDMGPDEPGAIKVCDTYYEASGEPKPDDDVGLFAYNVDFWTQEACRCYTGASGKFFTS